MTATITLTAARQRIAKHYAPEPAPEAWSLAHDFRRFASASPTTATLAATEVARYLGDGWQAAPPPYRVSVAPPEVAEAIRRIAAWAATASNGKFKPAYYRDHYASRRRIAAEAAAKSLAEYGSPEPSPTAPAEPTEAPEPPRTFLDRLRLAERLARRRIGELREEYRYRARSDGGSAPITAGAERYFRAWARIYDSVSAGGNPTATRKDFRLALADCEDYGSAAHAEALATLAEASDIAIFGGSANAYLAAQAEDRRSLIIADAETLAADLRQAYA